MKVLKEIEDEDITHFNQALVETPLISDFYSELPYLFDYYLETGVYLSRKNFFETLRIFQENPLEGPFFYIEKEIADIEFSYIDSGSKFIICFNKDKYSKEEVRNKIEEIYFGL